MTFKPATWRPIAIVLSVVNWVAAGLAIGSSEPLHATVHVAVAIGFALWAQRLGQKLGQGLEGIDAQARLDALEADVGQLRRELAETHERLDFAERLLARLPQSRPLDG